MIDELREELATLGQYIEVAEWERGIAIQRVRELMQAHGEGLHLPQVAQLTTLPVGTLRTMIREN